MKTNKVFVGNYPAVYDEAALRKLFRHIGHVIHVRQVVDKYSETSRGYSIITFATVQEAKKACEMMNEDVVDGRKLIVNPAYLPKNTRT